MIETVLYGGHEEKTMAQYEQLSQIEQNVDYNIIDYPLGAITNEQMAYALTCQRLFQTGETFTCTDDGTYQAGHQYMIVVSQGTKSWLDISPVIPIEGEW